MTAENGNDVEASTKTWGPDDVETSTEVARDGASRAPQPELRLEYLNERLAGRYRIRDALGSGGMGTVYRAVGVKLNREVTIKAILAGRPVNASMIHLLKEEAMIVASLSHPNIKQVYDVLEVDALPLIVMEYVEGINLADAVRGHKVGTTELVDILITICDAVGFAHARGVIHRDIKPSNIILTKEGVPKLADFGIAMKLSEESDDSPASKILAGNIMGSPSFMAPEQARGKLQEMDSRTDVYALGATLYAGLTGRPPFRGTPEEIIDQLLHSHILPPSRYRPVPKDLEAICLKCLHKNPAERYRGPYMLADDLRAFREGLPIKARSYRVGEKLQRAIGRRPNTFAFAMLAALTMFAGTFFTQLIHYRVARRAVLQEVREKVMGVAHTAAMIISPSYVQAVQTDADKDTPECRTLVRILKEIKVRNDAIEDAFIVRRSSVPEYVEFVVDDSFFDTPEELDRNGDGVVNPDEAPVVTGQLYTDTPETANLLRGFRGPVADEKVKARRGTGVALSGYAPIYDVNGESIAVIWVDVRADTVAESFRMIDRAFYGAVAFSVVLWLSLLTLILLWTVGLWDRPHRDRPRKRFFRPRASRQGTVS